MNGFLYACWSPDGEINKSFDDFLKSYMSLKKCCPNAKVALYTNINFDNKFGIDYIIFNKDIEKTFICKASGLLKSPFKNTIYLDNDIYIQRDIITDVFKMFAKFSFVVTYAANFGVCPGPNGGIFGVRKSQFTDNFLKEWLTKDISEGPKYWRRSTKSYDYDDQLSIYPLYYKHIKEFFILPPYFNYRSSIIGNYTKGVVICHDHSFSSEKVTKQIVKYMTEHKPKDKLDSIKTYKINHSAKKPIFIHIPKTGGKSVQSVIAKYNTDLKTCLHRRVTYYSEESRELCFTFSFVRNPFDRLVSAYKYLKGGHGTKNNTIFAKTLSDDFKLFVLNDLPNNMNDWFFRPMDFWLNADIDFIGKLENYENDFSFVCRQLKISEKLPHINKSCHSNYAEYYDSETIDVVTNLYKNDLFRFNYKFGE